MRRVVAAAVLGLLALAPPAAGGVDPCARFGEVAVAGTVEDGALTEISGLVASRAHPGVLWAHNDSGGAPALHAMGEDGRALGAYAVEGAAATDWEDMAAGPGPDGQGAFLYAGDIGDNAASRSTVTVYRVPEPAAAPGGSDGSLAGTAAIELRYPGGPEDAEALVVDPLSGDLLIVTKSYVGLSRLLRAPAEALVDGASVTLTDEGTISIVPPLVLEPGLPGTAVTGADVSPDGSLVLLRTYRSVLAYARGDGETMVEALRRDPCQAPQASEEQGESVGVSRTGDSYFTASEGSRVALHRVAISAPPAPTTTPTTGSSPTTATADELPATGGHTPVLLVAGAVLLVLLLVAALARHRRA